MKKTGLLLILVLAAAAFSQQDSASAPASVAASAPEGTVQTADNFPTIKPQTPTEADIYCAGFISKQLLPNASFVAGGLQTPNTTKFANGDLVYLAGGGYQAGQKYSIIRELRNPDENEIYAGQRAALKQAGQPYADIGRVRIVDSRGHMAIAEVEYSCDPINPGDLVTPFVERASIQPESPHRFDRFLPATGKLSARIIMAKDFDSELGTGDKIYLNAGTNQGVKVGDYFRATRRYERDLEDPVDSLSFKASTAEDTQKDPPSLEQHMFTKSSGPVIHVRDFPRRAVGEVVIIGTTATTATGMIVSSLEDIHVGDSVEMEEK